MNLFQEMEVNYKDFIESANDFMDSCREYKNITEDEDKIIEQLISLRDHCIAMDSEIFNKDAKAIDYILRIYKENIVKISNRESMVLQKEKEITKLKNEIYDLKKKIYAIHLLSNSEEE